MSDHFARAAAHAASPNPLAAQHPLYKQMEAAASVAPDLPNKILAATGAFASFVIGNARSLIDTPAERQQVEAVVVQFFNVAFGSYFGVTLPVIDAMLVAKIDAVLAAWGTVPTPAPAPVPVPVVPQGSAAP